MECVPGCGCVHTSLLYRVFHFIHFNYMGIEMVSYCPRARLGWVTARVSVGSSTTSCRHVLYIIFICVMYRTCLCKVGY